MGTWFVVLLPSVHVLSVTNSSFHGHGAPVPLPARRAAHDNAHHKDVEGFSKQQSFESPSSRSSGEDSAGAPLLQRGSHRHAGEDGGVGLKGEAEAVDWPALVRKLHARLLPLFVCLVIVCYLDRTALAFAALQLNAQLGFSPSGAGLAEAGLGWLGRLWALGSGAYRVCRAPPPPPPCVSRVIHTCLDPPHSPALLSLPLGPRPLLHPHTSLPHGAGGHAAGRSSLVAAFPYPRMVAYPAASLR
jgi:hypothetical protein